MCPVTLSVIAIGAALVGGALTYMGQTQAADASAKQAVYQQEQAAITAKQQAAQAVYAQSVDNNNAAAAKAAAAQSEAAGEAAANQQRQQTAALMGRQRAVLAANGVLVDSGSALDLTSDAAAGGTLDALTMKHNAALQTYSYQTQGVNYETQAQVDGSNAAYYKAGATSASNMATSGVFTPSPLTGVGGLLSTVGSVASSWYNMKYATPQTRVGSGLPLGATT